MRRDNICCFCRITGRARLHPLPKIRRKYLSASYIACPIYMFQGVRSNRRRGGGMASHWGRRVQGGAKSVSISRGKAGFSRLYTVTNCGCTGAVPLHPLSIFRYHFLCILYIFYPCYMCQGVRPGSPGGCKKREFAPPNLHPLIPV